MPDNGVTFVVLFEDDEFTAVDVTGAGKWWHEMPRPSRWHRCRPVTRAVTLRDMVERCPCGAIRYNKGPWRERNRGQSMLPIVRAWNERPDGRHRKER